MTRRRDETGSGPRGARWLLHRVIRQPDVEAIAGDIEEGYAAGRSGTWYWAQVLGSIASWWRRSLRAGGVRQDVGLALRKLRLRPGFSAVVVLTMALGIGANAAIFSVVNGVLLSPLPYADPKRLVVVRTDLTDQGSSPPASPLEFGEIAAGAPSLESVGGIWYRPAALTDDASEPEDIDMAFVTAGLLPTLGVTPLLGRHPLPNEDVAGSAAVIVLAEHLWQRRYGADPQIIGKRIEMDDEPHTVVGVMPAGFRVHLPPDMNMPPQVDAWVTFGGNFDGYGRTFRTFTVLGRMRADATRLDVDGELAAVASAARETFSEYSGTGYDLRSEALDDSIVAGARPLLLLLLGAVGLVLLIVCANVANLYLARASEARREIAVRRALGATPSRLLRALGVECTLITGLGAAAGLLVAWAAIAALPTLAPADLPRIQEVTLDLRVVGFAAVLAAATALTFAAVSALESQHGGAPAPGAGTRSAGSVTGSRLRGALLVAELALSLMLLIGVGLMVRSFANLADVDTGFDAANVSTIKMSLVDTHFYYAEPQKIADFYREVSEQVSAMPGVEAAGVTTHLPALTQTRGPYSYETAEGPTEWGADSADVRIVTPGWMEALRVRLLSGRFFDGSDDFDHPNVAIVDRKLAERAWPGEDALGKRLQVEVFVFGARAKVWAEVVGVVEHLRHDPASEGLEQIFLPHAQSPMRTTVLTIRTREDMPALGAAVAALVQGLDGDQPIGPALPMSEYIDATFAARRFALTLLSLFSGLAVILAVVGTYGVVSYGVSQRTREIGIQLAIGATPAAVVRSIVLTGTKLALVGVALGIVGAASVSRFLSSMLYGVAPTDPGVFAGLAAVMMLVTVVACYLPARRAAKLDPSLALRQD